MDKNKLKRKLLGLCINCNRPTNGKVTCDRCIQRSTKYVLKRYRERKKMNLCVGCGVILINEKYRCVSCKIKHKKQSYEKWQRQRQEVLCYYGGKCECCGINTPDFLEVDHINGGGNKHRKIVGRHFMSWIIRNNFPSIFRVLCASCNHGISVYGICPHQGEPSSNNKRTLFYRKQRRIAIEHYGGKCTCCGESNWTFLHFDHIKNDGAEHRRQGIKITPRWIIVNNYPKFLQLLCANCNKAKGIRSKIL